MGIADDIKAKVRDFRPACRSARMIARGDAEIGFQQVSELLHIAGIDYIGPLPPDIQHITVFAGGIHPAAEERTPPRRWSKFLTSPQAVPVIKKKGMDPG